MLGPRQLVRRLRDLARGRRLDPDVDDEIRSHIDMRAEALVRQGMPPGHARARAESAFGVESRVADHVREARGLSAANVADEIARDVRVAARALVRAPAFSLAAVATLALAIGATTAMFSVVNGVLLSGLPYPNAERLVSLRERGVRPDGRPYTTLVSAPNFADWHAQARSVDLMAAFRGGETPILGLSEPIRGNVYLVSRDYVRLFGGAPIVGRTFTDDEHALGGPPAALVSERFWRDHLGARRDLSAVALDVYGEHVPVVGVMPRGFGYPDDADVWGSLEPMNGAMGRDGHNDETLARLAPGVTMAQAQSELDAVAARLLVAYPTHNDAQGAVVTSLREALVGPVRKYLGLLLGAVLVLLLVGCVNLASANLARGAGRSRELAIRTVLGAGRGRLARQLLTESLLLAAVGGGAGVALARTMTTTLLALNPRPLPRAGAIGLSAPVLVFALAVTICTGILIGLLPALQTGASDLRAAITAGGRGTVVGRGGVRRALVGAEAACAVLLLVGAGLFVRSFRSLLDEKAGFDASGVLAVNVMLPDQRYPTGNRIAGYYDAALAALGSVPGVESASFINIAPLVRSGFGGGIAVEGRANEAPTYSDYRIVSPRYFETLRIPLLSGRLITDADDSTAQHVTVINQAMAAKFFPGENPLGKRLIELGMDRHRAVPMTVIGVVGDVRGADLSQAAGPAHFVPYRQRPERAGYGVFLLRTRLEPTSLAPTVRSRLRILDFNVLTQIETMTDIRARSLGDRRFTMVVLSGFAVLGLLLAAIGIYGVLAYSVSLRTREIGVRMALGAARERVVRMVLRDSLAPVVAGAAAGVVASLGLTRFIGGLLYGVPATDPLTFVTVTGTLIAVAVLASVVPAMRASRVDPVVALREE